MRPLYQGPRPPFSQIQRIAQVMEEWADGDEALEWLLKRGGFDTGILSWSLGGCSVLAHAVAKYFRKYGVDAKVNALAQTSGGEELHYLHDVVRLPGKPVWFIDFYWNQRMPARLRHKLVYTFQELRKRYKKEWSFKHYTAHEPGHKGRTRPRYAPWCPNYAVDEVFRMIDRDVQPPIWAWTEDEFD